MTYFTTSFISCQGKGFSLSIFSNGQILKMGISADYSVCKGKRKDGIACTMVINKYVTRFIHMFLPIRNNTMTCPCILKYFSLATDSV